MFPFCHNILRIFFPQFILNVDLYLLHSVKLYLLYYYYYILYLGKAKDKYLYLYYDEFIQNAFCTIRK